MKFESSAIIALIASFISGNEAFVVRVVPPSFSITTRASSRTAGTIVSSNPNINNDVASTTRLRMVDDDEDEYDSDDDEEYDPLEDGVDSVSWLPPISVAQQQSTQTQTMIKNGAEILPLFPLGGIVYTPNSEHVLNIFEPRYRQMYNDILMNGSKRFVVAMSHPDIPGTFAETGVIFHLEDLKEVSEETGDQIKYICNHKVTQRIKLHKILNPETWAGRETYLKVEGTIIDDEASSAESAESASDISDIEEEEGLKELKETDIYKQLVGAISPENALKSPEEMDLMKAFSNLVNKQHELEEDVRFTRASVQTLAVKPGSGENGLWMTIRLWQSFIEQRLMSRQNEMQMEFQEKLLEFLKKEKGMDENELPSAIGFNDLSPALQQEVQDLQKRMGVELQPLVLESTLAIQKILEAEDHAARCALLTYFMDAERKRLDAKKQLKGMFGGVDSGTGMGAGSIVMERVEFDELDDEEDDDDDDDEEEDDDDDDSGSSPSGSLLIDEPDAFQ